MAGTLHERIAEARRKLVRAGLSAEDASLDAEVLARHVLGWDRAALLTRGRDPATPAFIEKLDAAVTRRAAREPVALITGRREFWGLEFEVSRAVLIPRPETELIIESAVEHARSDAGSARRIVDVGTGSGCLSVSLAIELKGAKIVATDASSAALAVARRNAQRHGVTDNISFVRADLLEALSGPFDIIVSNPPYVPEDADLSADVARYEPSSALYAGLDGLAVLRRLIQTAGPRLAAGGAFIVEFGFGQVESIRSMAAAASWTRVDVKTDLQGIPRVAVMR
jgi:release factor glutamine methyltransferase